MVEPAEICRERFAARELTARHPPRISFEKKRLLLALAWPAGYVQHGDIVLSRWRAGALPDALGSAAPELVMREDFFAYEAAAPGWDDWYVNFADPRLFGFYGGALLAQDELQVAEHPALASLREAMQERSRTDPRLAPLTRDNDGPTPVLVRGAERRLWIDTTRGLYGNAFARASEEAIRAAVHVLDPARPSHIIAMAAPAGGRGEYDRATIEDALGTAAAAFSAARVESARAGAGPRVGVHSGNWGCGAFGGNRVLMTLVQLLAARIAGLDRLTFHTTAPLDYRSACAMAAHVPQRGFVEWLVAQRFQWGESDGN